MVKTRSGKEIIPIGLSPFIAKPPPCAQKPPPCAQKPIPCATKPSPCDPLIIFQQKPLNLEVPVVEQPKVCVLPRFSSQLGLSVQTSPFPEPSRQSPLFQQSIVEQQGDLSFFERTTPSPNPEFGLFLSEETVDNALSALQYHKPCEPAGVRKFALFSQYAPPGTPKEAILRKWLSQVVRSGMPWQDAILQIPNIMKNCARKIMMKNHARLYLTQFI